MTANEISKQVADFQVYDSGNRLLGLASLDLPDFSFETVDIKGAGILGTYNNPVIGHVESMEMTYHFRNLTNDALKYLQQHNAVELLSYGAVESYDAATGVRKINSIRIATRGLAKNLKPGKFEPAEQMETELTFELDYISIKENGTTRLEFDKFNYKYTANNVDYVDELKEAVGLE